MGRYILECEPPAGGKRTFGDNRDKRSDCVQVVIALIVTPQGFPMAYEVMPGNTSEYSTAWKAVASTSHWKWAVPA